MKFGVREITDIVFRSTSSNQKLGSLQATKEYQPLMFLDSAKTSTLESAVATVYAQGGRGNPRLLAWDGDKTVTFKFEDALISPSSFAALSGGDASTKSTGTMYLHLTEKVFLDPATGEVQIKDILGGLSKASDIKLLKLDTSGDISGTMSFTGTASTTGSATTSGNITGIYSVSTISSATTISAGTTTITTSAAHGFAQGDVVTISGLSISSLNTKKTVVEVVDSTKFKINVGTETGAITVSSAKAVYAGEVLVDFYVDVNSQTDGHIEISAEKFAGYYYLEANTLFRGADGKDYPAQFTIPKAKIQSNFTFTMASTGDPSMFEFTLDAFPAKTRFGTKKVLFSLDIADGASDVI